MHRRTVGRGAGAMAHGGMDAPWVDKNMFLLARQKHICVDLLTATSPHCYYGFQLIS